MQQAGMMFRGSARFSVSTRQEAQLTADIQLAFRLALSARPRRRLPETASVTDCFFHAWPPNNARNDSHITPAC